MFLVLMDTDSSGIDSLKTYEIPAIINFGFDSKFVQRTFYITQEIIPKYFDLDISDALYKTPWIVNSSNMIRPFEIISKGQVPGHYNIFLNNHKLNEPLSRMSNFDHVVVQFAKELTISNDQMHVPGLNVLTKTNHHERPFSFIQYTTGSYGSNLYTADLSRPLTNDLGFYLSGINWTNDGHRTNNEQNLNSFYTNFYWQKLIPGRLDIIYSTKKSGFPGSDQDTLNGQLKTDFIDASLCAGNENHKFTIYYTANTEEYSNLNTLSPFQDVIKTLGVDIVNSHYFQGFEGEYRLAGAFNMIDSDAYGSHNINSINYLVRLTKRFNNITLSGSCLFDLHNTEDLYTMPKFMTGIELFDSVFVFGSLSRYYRSPLITENHIPDSTYIEYYHLVGNPALQTEYYWSQELSIKRKSVYITLYKHDYNNRILSYNTNNDQLTVRNAESWQTIGIETALSTKIHLSQDKEKETATTVTARYYGNYLVRGDTLPLLPKGNSSIDLSIERQTRKFTIGAIFKERFIDTRQDLSTNEIDGMRIFSSTAYLRILDLHLSFQCDNVFDEEYYYIPGYRMPMRNYRLSVKWNFWD